MRSSHPLQCGPLGRPAGGHGSNNNHQNIKIAVSAPLAVWTSLAAGWWAGAWWMTAPPLPAASTPTTPELAAPQCRCALQHTAVCTTQLAPLPIFARFSIALPCFPLVARRWGA